MSRIRTLDPLVINKIAAGEVIERPASVVKELLENSLDALATRIEVDVAVGGAELIRVVDNGEGIHRDDLPLALSSHATSKLTSADDLFRVQTLGFRGEALASIASISKLKIRSRRAESDSGYELEVEGGKIGEVQPCGSPVGTRIEIRQLFANTPVRRKFLKTTGTEFGHLSEQFTRIALGHPRLHAVLKHNDKSVFELPPAERLIDRLRLFYGDELAGKLIEINSENDNIRLWGYVAHPSQSKSTRKSQYLFLNGRWIQDRTLQHALTEAYRGLLMVGRHPIAFLFLELPAEMVDVNVHPTKAEVRFRDSQQLYRQLLSTVRTTFLGMDLDSNMSLPSGSQATATPADPARQQELREELAGWAKGELLNWKPPARTDSETNAFEYSPSEADALSTGPPDVALNEFSLGSANLGSGSHEGEAHAVPPPASGGMTECGDVRAMQIHDCYLVVETADGLTVIDQHALHERVIYEQLRQRVLDGAVESQRMLVPETIELSPTETSLLLEQQELLAQLGFRLEEFGKNTLLLTAYPSMLGKTDLIQLVRDVADHLDSPRQQPTRRDILDGLLHMMSCKAAIKAGQRLKPEEMESLLAQRHLIDDAHHCPHGRPTALVLSRAELDRQFGRLG